jgi:hypothetical protein
MSGDVRPDVAGGPVQIGPYAAVPSAGDGSVAAATSGVEVSAAGGFVGAYPTAPRPEQWVGAACGFDDQHLVQIHRRGRPQCWWVRCGPTVRFGEGLQQSWAGAMWCWFGRRVWASSVS